METSPVTAVARVPVVVRCLDARGRAVSLSGRTLSRASTHLQDLLRRAYTGVRGDAPTEEVTVSFLEEDDGSLQLEYLVVDRVLPRRWSLPRGRRCARRRAQDSQTALVEATLVVTAAVEILGLVASATTARWTDSDNPAFADLLLEGTRTIRVPGAVRAVLGEEAAREQLRAVLGMFLDDDVEQLVIGKDPELPGRYQEAVVTRSPGLVDFLAGAPLTSLTDAEQERS